MSTTFAIRLDPLDVLAFRDGRPFDLGMHGAGTLPMPQSLAGAVRTHLWERLGIDFSRIAQALERSNGDVATAAAGLLGSQHAWAAQIRVCGPWLCNSDGPLVPVPADLVRQGKKSDDGPIVRLRPSSKPIPGWKPLADGMLPLWYSGSTTIDKAAGFLNAKGLHAYLEGTVPDQSAVLSISDLLEWEDRTGIGIDVAKGSAEDHKLFSTRFLRLKKDVCFYAEVELPDAAPKSAAEHLQGTIAFGGEGRRAQISTTGRFAWPAPKSKAAGELALLITPGIFMSKPNWRPDALGDTKLTAAAVPGSVAISGWDYARRCPKPVRHAVTAGAVYFADLAACQKSGPFVRLCSDKELNAQGYGLALKGVWNHG